MFNAIARAPLSATTVSRRLRAKGWNISPSGRRRRHEGMFVSGNRDNQVTIAFDFDVAERRTRELGAVTADLIELGYLVERSVDDDSAFLYVIRPAA